MSRFTCKGCDYLIFRQTPRMPEGEFVCFSGFSPCGSCKFLVSSNLKVSFYRNLFEKEKAGSQLEIVFSYE